MTPHRLCLIHPLDPRRDPAAVIEQRIAAIAACRPADFTLLLVGVDRTGDLELGRVVPVEVGGRSLDFLPVAHGADHAAFATGLLRRLAKVRAAARAEFSSVAVHSLRWAPLAPLVGRPVVLVVHRDPRADAVAGRVSPKVAAWEAVAMHVADRIIGCDADFVRRCRADSPKIAAKIEMLALSPAGADGLVPLFGEEAQLTRLWERHRRLYGAQALHRGHHAAA